MQVLTILSFMSFCLSRHWHCYHLTETLQVDDAEYQNFFRQLTDVVIETSLVQCLVYQSLTSPQIRIGPIQ